MPHNSPKTIPSSIEVNETYIIYKSIKRVNVLICNEKFPLGRCIEIVISWNNNNKNYFQKYHCMHAFKVPNWN